MPTGIDTTDIKRTPVRLVLNPSNLSAAFPYGGTALGAASAVVTSIDQPYHEIASPERGGLAEVVKGPVRAYIACSLREWNDTVLSTLFAEASTGGSTGEKMLIIPGSNSYSRPGSLLSNRAVKILAAAYDATNWPSIYLPRAVPILARENEVRRGPFSERVFDVVFLGMLDATNRVYIEGKLADMTL